MLLTRRSVTLGTVAGAAASALAPDALSATALGATGSSTDDSQVVLDWERITFRTVYTDTLTPVPVGVPGPRLRRGRGAPGRGRVSPRRRQLRDGGGRDGGARRPRALLPDPGRSAGGGPRGQPHRDRPSQARQGHADRCRCRRRLIASRTGDHYLDPSLHYAKAPGPGVWQPNPGSTDMLAPWLGSLRPLVLSTRRAGPGPHALASSAYAAEYDEVRRLGS